LLDIELKLATATQGTCVATHGGCMKRAQHTSNHDIAGLVKLRP
jgi:hypothetical protein